MVQVWPKTKWPCCYDRINNSGAKVARAIQRLHSELSTVCKLCASEALELGDAGLA